ncbi:hypothetical protein ACWD7C_06490 [Streptomyces sp. NPDC005134]|uniref:hypothetical protein n=1 Tax=Streptomyces sp. NPDC005098 TaxID=3154560 RepID=UPI0033A97546
MISMVLIAGGGVAVVIALVPLFNYRGLATLAASVLLVLAMFSGVIGNHAPKHLLLLAVTMLALWGCHSSARWVTTAVLIGAAITSVCFVALPGQLEHVVRVVVLLPAAFILGMTLRDGDRVALIRVYSATAVLLAALASIESWRGEWIFARPDFTGVLHRHFAIRAVVGAEHPLTLALFLAAAVPLVLSLRMSGLVKFGAIAMLCLGISATASRGALGLVVAGLILPWVGRLRGREGRGLASKAASLGIGAALLWTVLAPAPETAAGVLTSKTPEGASAEYRLRLYQAVGDSLASQPLGWGWDGLPQNVYLLRSHFGIRDIAATVDSEVALLAFDFGLIGVALYLAAMWSVGRRTTDPISQAAFLLLLGGLYLALHSWSGLGALVMLMVGMSLGTPADRDSLPNRAHPADEEFAGL